MRRAHLQLRSEDMPGWTVFEGLQYVENPPDPEAEGASDQAPPHTVTLRRGTCVLLHMAGLRNELGIARMEQVLQV